MKNITINGKDYTLEFTFEASLYNECIEETINLVSSLVGSTGANPIDAIKSMASIPSTTITMFYAGLLENHKDEIKGIEGAKKLAKEYLKENKDNENGTFFALMNTLMECMEDDGFFKQVGLDKLMETVQTETPSRKRK